MYREKNETIKIDFRVPKNKAEQIQKYANKHHGGNVSMTVREFIDKGLSINSYKEEITFIREMIREEINTEIEPRMERLIKIMLKGSVMSSATYFLCAKVISKFVPTRLREDFSNTLSGAKKLGASYIRNVDFSIEKEAEKYINED